MMRGSNQKKGATIEPPEEKSMARIYLRVGNREIPVTDEQVKAFNLVRENPKEVAVLRNSLLAEYRPKKAPATASVIS